MNSVLMIAYHFPPMAASSGIQRTLAFARHLPELGWRPIVLSVHPRAYTTRDDAHVTLPDGIVIRRAFALDTARHLSLFGKYPTWLARPDRWSTWWIGGVLSGLSIIGRYRPAAIWSTYPIATAHLIAATLQRLCGLPWLADFRDPMTEDGYPADPRTRRSFGRIERTALRRAAASVFVTESAMSASHARYPDVAPGRFHLIENGYDEDAFRHAEQGVEPGRKLNPGRLTLLHSGIVYPGARDPTQLMVALARLRVTGRVSAQSLQVRFRAPVHAARLTQLSQAHGVEDLVQILPQVTYQEALQEMLETDGLLLLQGATCNNQVPAKLYEYLRARRPILALTHPDGATAMTLRRFGLEAAAPLESSDAIESGLRSFLDRLESGNVTAPPGNRIERYSRKGQTRLLADLLDQAKP